MTDVILPAVDEAEAIVCVLAAMPAGVPKIGVANGSTDATAQHAASARAEAV